MRLSSKTYWAPALIALAIAAAPVFCQSQQANPNQAVSWVEPRIENGQLIWFELNEDRTRVGQMLGKPALVAEFGKDFYAWQYQLGELEDHDDYSHYLVFRKSSGKLVSIARQFVGQRAVDEWFPERETKTYFLGDAEKPQFQVRLRRLSGGRILLAMGVSKPGQQTGQVLLIREEELPIFYPWIHLTAVTP